MQLTVAPIRITRLHKERGLADQTLTDSYGMRSRALYESKLSSRLGELGLAARACPFMVVLAGAKAGEEKICVLLMPMRGDLGSTKFWCTAKSAAAGSSVFSLRLVWDGLPVLAWKERLPRLSGHSGTMGRAFCPHKVSEYGKND